MKDVSRLGVLSQLGWVVAVAVLVPLGLGLWLDQKFLTSPLFVFVGAVIGILAATIGVVRVTTQALEKLAEPAHTQSGKENRKEDEE